jgi:glycosyltransferase involved in cell wall biosynthesis
MHEGPCTFHNLEWPPDGATVAGPVVWLCGWAVGRPGTSLTDIRVRTTASTHLGVLGLPRTDLAAHFEPGRAWLPAEFVVGVPLADGPAEITIEVMDAADNWHLLQSLRLNVSQGGAASPRTGGEVIPQPGGSWTLRGTHLPFHGHLDDPAVTHGLLAPFGWLLHEGQSIRRLLATVDGLVFHHLAHGLTDASLAAKVPHLPAAATARFLGRLDLPVTVPAPALLRIYAELGDGSTHLCFARRVPPGEARPVPAAAAAPAALATLAALPARSSGRPHRLLFVTGTLEPEDAALRALDLARTLAHGGQWVARLITAEDGVLRQAFEDADCPVQFVDLRALFAGRPGAADQLTRQIWWSHLDAVVCFDEVSRWIEAPARARGLPVLSDPAAQTAWVPPGVSWTHDPAGPLVAPIRGLAACGASVLLRAGDHLARHHVNTLAGRRIHLTALGATEEERRFLEDVELNRPALFTTEPPPSGLAAVVNPAWERPPVRALLAALDAGVPLITTRVGLPAGFGPHEAALIPAGPALALAHAITDVLANPAAARRRAIAARTIAATHHAFADASGRWFGALRAAIAARGLP